MTTKTAPEAATTTDNAAAERPAHHQGSELLTEVIAQLQHFGYRRVAIDTWRNDAERHTARHAYAGGEWTVTHWLDGAGQVEVRWSTRATMPDIKTVMAAILPVPF
jgi:hypothetical protein